MANKKMTKRDYFEAIKSKYDLTVEEIAFIDHELELLEKKNASKSSKPTKTQESNEKLKSAIVEEMVEGERYTITEMLSKLPCCEGYTNSKITALVTQLVRENEVVRIEEKGKAYFSLA